MRISRWVLVFALAAAGVACDAEPACDSFCDKLAACGPPAGRGCQAALQADDLTWEELLACRFGACVEYCEMYDVVLRPELMATLDHCVRRTACPAFSLDACFAAAAQVVDPAALVALTDVACGRQLACGQVASAADCRQTWLADPYVQGLVIYAQGVLACGGECIRLLPCERLDMDRMGECLTRCGVLFGA
ncbi:MAG TPA: hypothetical protein PK668_04775 [Myxococcota bacterium]|nr:hypothetical protein [Myxococcota bacterium]HRY92175.1 hypothetical protein [Myxococcota bacterium]HSA22362.1 hypothetical protein [Myxococcota bacterium]